MQRQFVLVFSAVPFNIFLLLCLDKVCRSVGYCTPRPMKVILWLIFIHESMGWIIQLNIALLLNVKNSTSWPQITPCDCPQLNAQHMTDP